LYLCKENVTSYPERCTDSKANLGRWITAYGREGRWLSNNTAALPLLAASDGAATLHFRAVGVQPYEVTLFFLLRRSSAPATQGRGPVLARMPLWEGGKFDQDYNERHQPMSFEVPQGTKKVVLSSILTGHGWGADEANCAEFCNHTHHFSVNGGEEVVRAFPVAGTEHGCQEQVGEGVVPNQYGSWPAGRAGWCPGKHVDWWEADVTQWLLDGGNKLNSISYRALFDGKNYAPKPSSDPQHNGFAAEIHLTSALTFYGATSGEQAEDAGAFLADQEKGRGREQPPLLLL